MQNESILDIGKRIKAIADIGLLYTNDKFDLERYQELKTIGEKLITDELKLEPASIHKIFAENKDYPTPKVDVRSMVLNEKQEILMVQESADQCWSLPGGWADIGMSASEIAIKEVWEETGLHVHCKNLLAVFDKRKHPHPPQPYYVYKMIFHCEVVDKFAATLKPAFDILDVGWFSIDALPPLSKERILATQIELVYHKILNLNFQTIFD